MEYRVFKDGDAWCATGAGFVNLQESIAGFGDSPTEALSALVTHEKEVELLRRQSVREWKCNNCGRTFSRKWEGDHAPCPTCKAGAQYTNEVPPNTQVQPRREAASAATRC